MTPLPTGWTHFTIARLGGLVGGKTPSKSKALYWSPGEIPWISPKDMKQAVLADSADRISRLALTEAGMALLPIGSVLMVTRSGILAHTFPVALTAAASTINQDIKAIRPHSAVDPRYLAYLLRANGPRILAACSKDGTTVASVESDRLEAIEFPLAPNPEQIRIAEKLDTLLARVDACRQRLDRLPQVLTRFRQSVLTAAISGRLTSEWRANQPPQSVSESLAANKVPAPLDGDHKLDVPNSWCVVRARDVVDPSAGIVYGIVQPGPKLSAGVPYVQITDIVAGRIQVQGLSLTSNEIAKGHSRSSIAAGDVLLGIIRATKVAVVPTGIDGANISRSVARLRPREGLLPAYLALALEAPAVQSWLRAQHRGMDMPVLNLSEVRLAPIPIAPLEEQVEIVRRVKALFTLADDIEARWRSARTQVERITPAVLAKAFRGELVPQDPNDEPASTLLARIRAGRAAAPIRKKRGPKATNADA